jgi:hypothetical protein
MITRKSHLALMACLLGSVTACSKFKKHPHDDDEAFNQSEQVRLPLVVEDQELWFSQVKQLLSHSHQQQNIKDIDVAGRTLDQSTRRSIVLEMLDTEYFYNMVAEFGSYWMGLKPNEFFETKSSFDTDSPGQELKIQAISDQITGASTSVYAARELSKNHSFFKSFFSEYVTVIPDASVLKRSVFFGKGNDVTFAKNDLDSRKQIREKIMIELTLLGQDVLAELDKNGPQKACELFESSRKGFSYSVGEMGHLGNPMADTPLRDVGYIDVRESRNPCQQDSDDKTELTAEKIQTYIKQLVSQTQTNIRLINAVESIPGVLSNEMQKLVTHLTAIEGPFEGKELKLLGWNPSLFVELKNSSTNRNRKRANWVLKRFFCDDLTPLQVQTPSDHGGSSDHASNPACYSCHYKLDPMAGFFRERGIFGYDFSAQKEIFFDDFVSANRSDYERPWKSNIEGREWNIGYIRSVKNTNENLYGSKITDLLRILQKAPEVKQCFIKRAFEYVVGEGQSMDSAWANEVLQRYEASEAENPKEAMKGLFADLISSDTFAQINRDRQECYDFAAGTKSSNLPCPIRGIIEKNCQSCHSETNRQAGLDLTNWQPMQGSSGGFVWQSEGKTIAGTEGVQRIIDRLNTSDDDKRMPLMKLMPDAERQSLFHWLDDLLKNNK